MVRKGDFKMKRIIDNLRTLAYLRGYTDMPKSSGDTVFFEDFEDFEVGEFPLR